jgi:phosphoglycerate dehydrogenase-like enzyme
MRVLVSDRAKERFADILSAEPDVTWVTPGTSELEAEIEAAWLSVDLLYDGTGPRFVEMLMAQPSLRWLQSSFAGTDHPIFRPLMERGVRVCTSHENSISIAEFVLGSVLRALQRPQDWATAQAESAWAHHEFSEVYGTTWLVIGLGAIGSAVVERASAFGVRTIGVRRSLGVPSVADEVITPDLIAEVLGQADVVVLARPGGTNEPALVGADFLDAMKHGSILINVARGSLVDESALLSSLDRDRPALAILDVFQQEPLDASSALWAHPKVVITPHASSGGLGRHQRNARLFVANLRSFRSGGSLRNEVALTDLDDVGSAPAQFKAPPHA